MSPIESMLKEKEAPAQAQEEASTHSGMSNGRFMLVLAGILVLSAFAYLSLAYNWPKFSRAEVFFADCVREMFQADNLVTPLYHGTPFFDKPILSYWFIALAYKIFGLSHFSARIPSVIAAVVTVALTGFSCKHIFGARSGIMAAAVLASSLMYLSFANLCMSDMSLVMFDCTSLILLYAALQNEKHRSSLFYLGSLSMGLAFLTKGPVGIVLPAASFALYLCLTKNWKKISFIRHVIPCSLILLGAGVPWFMAAYRQNGGAALSYFFIHENLERFAGATYDTHRPIWFMIVSLFGGMLPWSILIPFAALKSVEALSKNTQLQIHESTDTSSQRNATLYLWLWTLVVLGFFSLSRGKIDYYALPCYPAVAIIVGDYLSKACDAKSRVAIIGAWLVSVLMLLAGAASFLILPGLGLKEGLSGWLAMPIVLVGCGLSLSAFTLKTDYRQSFKMLFVSISLIAIAFSFEFYPWISSKQAVLKYIPYLKELKQDDRIGVYTSLQNWIDELSFQTDKEPMKIQSIKMAEQFLKGSSKSVLLIQESEYNQMSDQAKANSRVLQKSPFIPRSLNPIYFIKRGEKLGGNARLLLVVNKTGN